MMIKALQFVGIVCIVASCLFVGSNAFGKIFLSPQTLCTNANACETQGSGCKNPGETCKKSEGCGCATPVAQGTGCGCYK
jgi:hypothetical protein